MKRKAPMRRGGPLRRTGRLARQSAKRMGQEGDYRQAVWLATLRDGGECYAHRLAWQITVPYPAGCGGPVDPHHVLPLGRGGARCDPANIRLLCRLHHDWVHGHPRIAATLGMLASRITSVQD